MIVSGFLARLNSRADRDTETYIRYGRILAAAPVPKILFIDRDYIHLFSENRYTKCIPLAREDLYLSRYLPRDMKLNLDLYNPEKDTLSYFEFICQKTELLVRAMEYTDAAQLIWIDFGIVSVCPEEILYASLEKMQTSEYTNVRIGHITDLGAPTPHLFSRVYWHFAGGCFGGARDALREFAALTKEEVLSLVKENKLVWEVNIWILVFRRAPKLFSPYRCDHNASLLVNYV